MLRKIDDLQLRKID